MGQRGHARSDDERLMPIAGGAGREGSDRRSRGGGRRLNVEQDQVQAGVGGPGQG